MPRRVGITGPSGEARAVVASAATPSPWRRPGRHPSASSTRHAACREARPRRRHRVGSRPSLRLTYAPARVSVIPARRSRAGRRGPAQAPRRRRRGPRRRRRRGPSRWPRRVGDAEERPHTPPPSRPAAGCGDARPVTVEGAVAPARRRRGPAEPLAVRAEPARGGRLAWPRAAAALARAAAGRAPRLPRPARAAWRACSGRAGEGSARPGCATHTPTPLRLGRRAGDPPLDQRRELARRPRRATLERARISKSCRSTRRFRTSKVERCAPDSRHASPTNVRAA
jgi:hypothetical protein